MSLCVDAAFAALSGSASSSNLKVLGTGAQRLTGSAAGELIYADRRPGDGDDLLVLRDAARAVGQVGLTDPGAAAAVVAGGSLMFFGADAALGEGGAAGWAVGADARLSSVWTQSSWSWDVPMLTGSGAIMAVEHAGAAWLVTGGWGLSLARIDAAGTPQLMDTVWSDGRDGLVSPGAFAGWSQGGDLHILVGGGSEGGLSSYIWDGAALSLEVRIADSYDLRLNNVAAIETLSFGRDRYALTLSKGDAGLTVWNYQNGALTETDRRSPLDAETRGDLFGATSLAVVELIGEALVYAATDRGLLICWRLDADGRLERLWDREGVTHVEQMRVGAADFLAMTDGAGVVTLAAIGVNGRLTETASLYLGDDVATGGLVAAPMSGAPMLMTARPDAGGFDLLEFAVDGDDTVYAGAGDDRIFGGGGDDRLYGQAGADVIRGEGDDDFILGGGADDVLDGGDGDDELRGGPDDDVLTGGAGADVLKGGNGRDMLDGGAGADVLKGGMLKDEIRGGGGGDLIWGGYGHDDIWGGFGADVIYGHWGWDVVYGGDGADWIGGGNGDDRLYGEAGNDTIKGALGKDSIWGGGGADQLHGGGFADKIWGGAGDDFLYGDDGADKLFGGDGADRLEGGRHADQLTGGAGADQLLGGAGPDRFIFARGWGRDVIFDFKNGQDKIVFESGANAFRQLEVETTNGGVLIHAGDPFLNSIKLLGVTVGQIDASDFDFL